MTAKAKKLKRPRGRPKKEKITPTRADPVAAAGVRKGGVLTGQGKAGGKPATKIIPPSPEDAGGRYSRRYLRYAAGVYYATDIHSCSLEQMSRHPVFGQVDMPTLQRWCQKDGWVRRREENLEKWRVALEKRIGSELMRTRHDTVQALTEVQQDLFAKVKQLGMGLTAVNSFEGLVKALLQTTDLVDKLRDKMAADLNVVRTGGGYIEGLGTPELEAELTEDELLAGAHAILEARIKRQEEEQAQQKETEDGSEDSDD